jgi:hypothetical protein
MSDGEDPEGSDAPTDASAGGTDRAVGGPAGGGRDAVDPESSADGGQSSAGAEEPTAEDEDRPADGEDRPAESPDGSPAPEGTATGDGDDLADLRSQVEEKYDFEAFGPSDMAAMSADEWEAAFDPDAWITGEELLDRVEADLRSRVADRDVFAVVERVGDDRPRVVAYSDSSYAVVHLDGSVEGEGPVFQDVKPTVALTSMPDYEVPEPPAEGGLPEPSSVPESAGGLGNLALQLIAGLFGLAGLALLGAALLAGLGGATVVAIVIGLVFLVVAVLLLLTVANSRLAARYRAEEYRDRLRGARVGEGERPEFLPIEDSEFED